MCVLTEVGEDAAEEGQPATPQTYEGNGEKDKTAVPRPEPEPRPPAEYELAWDWKKEGVCRTLSGTDPLCHIIVNGRHLSHDIILTSIRLAWLKST